MSAREVITELKKMKEKPIQVTYIYPHGQAFTRMGTITEIIEDVGFYIESSPHELKMTFTPTSFISFLSCEISDWSEVDPADPEWLYGDISRWSMITQWKARLMSWYMNKADVMQRIFS
jgi:hypothetical protein